MTSKKVRRRHYNCLSILTSTAGVRGLLADHPALKWSGTGGACSAGAGHAVWQEACQWCGKQVSSLMLHVHKVCMYAVGNWALMVLLKYA